MPRPQTSKITVIETTQVEKGSSIVTTSRFVRKTVYTKPDGQQYVNHMGEHLPVEPHPILRMPRYIVRKTLPQ